MVRIKVPCRANEVGVSRATQLPAAATSSAVNRCWRVTNGAAFLLFSAAAVVQWNDPDPHVWMPFYGVAAVISAHVTATASTPGGEKSTRGWWRGVCVLELLYSLGLATSTAYYAAEKLPDMLRQPFVQEEARELAGALTVFAYILLLTLNRENSHVTALGAEAVALCLLLLLVVVAAAGFWLACWTPLGVSLPYCASLCGGSHTTSGDGIASG